MPAFKLSSAISELPVVKTIDLGVQDVLVDVTSLRLQISSPFVGDAALAGYMFPRINASLQYTGDAILVPGDSGYIDQVDLLVNSYIVKTATATVDTQMQTWNQRSMPGDESFVNPFYIGIDYQGSVSTSAIIEVTVFWKMRKGTELERTAAAVKLWAL